MICQRMQPVRSLAISGCNEQEQHFREISDHFCLLTSQVTAKAGESAYNALFCAHAQIRGKEEVLGAWKQ